MHMQVGDFRILIYVDPQDNIPQTISVNLECLQYVYLLSLFGPI